jgi:hypothetical protein
VNKENQKACIEAAKARGGLHAANNAEFHAREEEANLLAARAKKAQEEFEKRP